MNIAFSVVVPLYNSASTIERTLQSLQAQTMPDFEVVVVDDGSTDRGGDVVRQFGDNRLRLITQCNSGVSAARNSGIQQARSDLVAFLDSDDEWMPHYAATIIRLRDTFPTCDVFGTSYVRRTSGAADRPISLWRLPRQWEGVIDSYFDVASRSDPPLCSSVVAVTKSALASIGGFPTGIYQGEDLLTWARLAARFSIAYSTRPSAAFWVPHQQDTLVPKRCPQVPDVVGRQLKSLLNVAEQRHLAGLRRYIGLWHKMRGKMFLRLADYPNSRRELGQAIRWSPLDAKIGFWCAMAWMPSRLSFSSIK